MRLFEPIPASGAQLACDTATDTVALGIGSQGEFQVSVYNSSSDTDAFVDFGPSSITTTATTGHPIPHGQVRGFTIKATAKDVPYFMAGITASGTATLQVNRGHGI